MPSNPLTTPPAIWPRNLMLICILCGVAAAALAFYTGASGMFIDVKWLVIGLITAPLIIFYAWSWRTEQRQAASFPGLIGLSAMAAGIILASICARHRAAAIYALPFFLLPFGWAAMTLTVRWTRANLQVFQQSLIILGALVALIALGQYYAPGFTSEILGYGDASAVGRSSIYSTIGNPEYLGGFLAPLAVLALAGLWREMKRSAALAILQGIAFILIFWAMVLTEARGAWIGFIAGSGVLAFCLWSARSRLQPEENDHPKPTVRDSKRGPKAAARAPQQPKNLRAPKPLNGKWKWIFPCLALLLLVLLILPTPLNPDRVNLLERVSQSVDLSSASVQQRLLVYTITADMIRTDGWIGLGPNAFAPQFAVRLAGMRNRETEGAIMKIAWRLGVFHPGFVHSEPLQFWVESGLLGIGGFLLIVAASMLMVWKSLRQIRNPEPDSVSAPGSRVDALAFYLFSGFSSAWFCGLVGSLLSFPFHIPDRVLLYWTLFGLMGAGFQTMKDKRSIVRDER